MRSGSRLTVLASPDTVRVLDGIDEVAQHPPIYDRGKTIEIRAHIEALVEAKRRAGKGHTLNRLIAAVPSLRQVFDVLANEGGNLGNATLRLTRLLDAYGPEEMERAISEALDRGRAHPGAIEQILHRLRCERGKRLPNDAAVSELASRLVRPVRMPELAAYDRLGGRETTP